MVHQNKNIKTKNTKNNLLPYSTPNVSNIHIIPKSWLLWSLHTNNVWEDRTLGSPQNSAVLMSPMFGRKSEDHTNTYLYHKQFTNNLLYFTTSLTIYFTLLHSLKTRLFINPVLNDSNLIPGSPPDMQPPSKAVLVQQNNGANRANDRNHCHCRHHKSTSCVWGNPSTIHQSREQKA